MSRRPAAAISNGSAAGSSSGLRRRRRHAHHSMNGRVAELAARLRVCWHGDPRMRQNGRMAYEFERTQRRRHPRRRTRRLRGGARGRPARSGGHARRAGRRRRLGRAHRRRALEDAHRDRRGRRSRSSEAADLGVQFFAQGPGRQAAASPRSRSTSRRSTSGCSSLARAAVRRHARVSSSRRACASSPGDGRLDGDERRHRLDRRQGRHRLRPHRGRHPRRLGGRVARAILPTRDARRRAHPHVDPAVRPDRRSPSTSSSSAPASPAPSSRRPT